MTIKEAIRILTIATDNADLSVAVNNSENYFGKLNEACQLAADELHKRQWISVEDRLPEPMYQVLIYTDDGWIGVDALDYNEEFREYDYVTHWQPLPEPPKEPSKKGV